MTAFRSLIPSVQESVSRFRLEKLEQIQQGILTGKIVIPEFVK
jgi:hypothetical protein